MDKPIIKKECVKTLYETKIINIYDFQYEDGQHYYNATRRAKEDIVATKSSEDYKVMLPDAVSCVLVLRQKGEEPKLLLSREYRYPAGQFLLSVPAGLIDEKELTREEAVKNTAIREIKEETELTIKETDRVEILSPFLFSSPGLTDESNAFVLVDAEVDDLNDLNQDGIDLFCVGFVFIIKCKNVTKLGADHIQSGHNSFL